MKVINLGSADGLPAVDWAAIVAKLEILGNPIGPNGH